jgi:signal transduction histidine kinase
MLPRSLRNRIFLAFALLGVALLATVTASLFLVLRDLHEEEIKQTLGFEVVAIEVSLNANPVNEPAGLDRRVKSLTQSIVDQGGFILAQGPRGIVRVVAGNPSSTEMPDPPPTGAKNVMGTLTTSDGQRYVYIQPNAKATSQIKFVFALPDTSVRLALEDIFRTIWIVTLVLLLVGVPIAWLLARSVTAPMRRLAQAAGDLPAASGTIQPLPPEGPSEVRVLIERFNAMSHELAATRHEESQMLANLRHDLRTPLTSIGGFAEAIADGTASGERARAAAITISEEAERLERLVGELGVVERLREGAAALRPEALDAGDLLEEAVARFGTRASAAGVTLEIAGPDGGAASPSTSLVFTGDRLAAERILQNLVENALSVVAEGGHIWLRAFALTMPGRPPGISISVTDDGPGFPPGTSERVFERFFRADPSRSGSGSGLGLAIVRELARAHGGEAWAENVAPHGARVSVLLPISPIVARPSMPPHE